MSERKAHRGLLLQSESSRISRGRHWLTTSKEVCPRPVAVWRHLWFRGSIYQKVFVLLEDFFCHWMLNLRNLRLKIYLSRLLKFRRKTHLLNIKSQIEKLKKESKMFNILRQCPWKDQQPRINEQLFYFIYTEYLKGEFKTRKYAAEKKHILETCNKKILMTQISSTCQILHCTPEQFHSTFTCVQILHNSVV